MADERELVRQAARGDLGAFEALFLQYRDHAFAVAMSILGEPNRAVDVAQDAFLIALEGLPRLRDHSRFPAWLTTIVRRRAYRERRRRWMSLDELCLDEPVALWEERTPLQSTLAAEAGARLREALEELPARLGRVLQLKYSERLSYREIAEALDVPVSTIRARLYDARQSLKRDLGDFESVEDLRGGAMSAETMPFAVPAIRVRDAEPAAAPVDILEDPLRFLRLEVGARAETVTFHCWDRSNWAPPRMQGRVAYEVVGPATVEDEPCVEVQVRVYEPDGRSPRSEAVEFAARTDEGFLTYVRTVRDLRRGTTTVHSFAGREVSPTPLWPPRIAPGETYTRYGMAVAATRWVEVAINGRPFRCVEVVSELGGADEGEDRYDRHYVAEDGRVVLRLRYDTQRTWEHRPDVEPLQCTEGGRTYHVERSTVPRDLLHNG